MGGPVFIKKKRKKITNGLHTSGCVCVCVWGGGVASVGVKRNCGGTCDLGDVVGKLLVAFGAVLEVQVSQLV